MTINYIPKIIYNATTIEFDYPAEGFDVDGKKIKGVGKVSVSAGGGMQTSFNYLEEQVTLKFKAVTSPIITNVEAFFKTWALLGKEFDFYPHKSEATNYQYKLQSGGRLFDVKQTTPGNYSFTLKMRRVL